MTEERSRVGGMWRYGVPVAIFAVIFAFFYRGLYLNPAYVNDSPLIGKPAPEFSLPGLQDPSVEVGTADISGEFALLNVWGTWCPECRHEHGFLVELAQSGVPILGLNWNDDRDAAIRWLDTLGDPYVATATDVVGEVAIDYGVYGAPETFLIAPDRTILAKRVGVITPEVWQGEFVPAIEAYRESN